MEPQAIRIIVAGIGHRGSWGLLAISKSGHYQVVGLVDAIQQRMQLITREYAMQSTAQFTNLSEALSRVDADAVAIFTPDGTHAELIIPALEAQKFVFVEKPLDITEDRLQKVVDADARAGGRT